MESGTFGKQGQAAYLPSLFSTDSQLSNETKTNFQSNFLKGFYLVPKCMNKRVADQSAIGLPMYRLWISVQESGYYEGLEEATHWSPCISQRAQSYTPKV